MKKAVFVFGEIVIFFTLTDGLLLFLVGCIPKSFQDSTIPPSSHTAQPYDIGTVMTPMSPDQPQEFLSQTPDTTSIIDPFIPLDTATIESSLTPTLTPTATEIQPSATAINTATPEMSPTPDGLWCNDRPYLKTVYKIVNEALEKDPNAVPILQNWPSSFGNIGDNPDTPEIEPQQSISTVATNSDVIRILKEAGFNDDQIKNCRKKNQEPFLNKNWISPDIFLLKENIEQIMSYDIKDEGRGTNVCYWEKTLVSPERRKFLEKLYPKLRSN